MSFLPTLGPARPVRSSAGLKISKDPNLEGRGFHASAQLPASQGCGAPALGRPWSLRASSASLSGTPSTFSQSLRSPARLSLTPQDEKGPVLVLPHLGTRRSCASCSVGTATAACLLCTLPSGSTVEKPRVSKDKADHSPGSPIPQSRGPPPLGCRTVPVHGP